MVDVRSPQEFTGEILAPPGLPETCQRGGHIPSARSIPWGKACNEDGTFKSADELQALYAGEGVDGSKPVIAYCRIGERSSHTWFVLKYLLGFDKVVNYDGSWTEWGNLVGAPVERGKAAAKANAERMKVEEYQERKTEVAGWPVNLAQLSSGRRLPLLRQITCRPARRWRAPPAPPVKRRRKKRLIAPNNCCRAQKCSR